MISNPFFFVFILLVSDVLCKPSLDPDTGWVSRNINGSSDTKSMKTKKKALEIIYNIIGRI